MQIIIKKYDIFIIWIIKDKQRMFKQIYKYLCKNKDTIGYCIISLTLIFVICFQLRQQKEHMEIYQLSLLEQQHNPSLESDRINLNEIDINMIQDWSRQQIWTTDSLNNNNQYQKQDHKQQISVTINTKQANVNKGNNLFNLKQQTMENQNTFQNIQQIIRQSNEDNELNDQESIQQVEIRWPKGNGQKNRNMKNLAKAPILVKSGAGINIIQKQKWFKFRQLKDMPLSSEMAQEEKKYYDQKYNTSSYPELPFCVIIPSYNNVEKQRYIHNINSVLQQDYSNYHIILIDDASEDKTGEHLQTLARSHQISEQKLKIIINKQRIMAMPNLHKAIHQFCQPYELLLIVDGDDELVGKQILKFFNAIFQTYDIWLAYSNFVTFRGSLGYSRSFTEYVIKQNKYRTAPFTISHLRVFYAKLFMLIDQKDLKDEQGKWFRAANDVAMYLPILQMAHTRIAYFPEISYLYNSNTGLNNHKTKTNQQKSNQKIVKKKNPYKPLQNLFTQKQIIERQKSLDKKIPIKDLNIPSTSGIQKLGWQL